MLDVSILYLLTLCAFSYTDDASHVLFPAAHVAIALRLSIVGPSHADNLQGAASSNLYSLTHRTSGIALKFAAKTRRMGMRCKRF
jgi:hypothetical protein